MKSPATTNPTLTIPDGTSFAAVESSAESAGARMQFEITMPPDAIAPPRHTRPSQEETWTVLSGELSVQVDDDWRSLRAGDTLTIPPGTTHTLKNRSKETIRFRDVHLAPVDQTSCNAWGSSTYCLTAERRRKGTWHRGP